MSSIGDALAKLTPQQRKLVELRLQKKGIAIAKHQIGPREGDLPWYPLSFSQQRLWFLDRLEPGNSAYHVSSPVRLHGPLEPAWLAAAVDAIVQRHEALRTHFEERDDLPVQRVDERRQSVPLVDLTGLRSQQAEAASTRLTTIELQRSFDLARGPLLRTILLRLGGQEHGFLMNMHHIVSDGWSLSIFFRELQSLYASFAENRPSALAPLPLQYADFAVWQRGYLEGDVLEEQLAYWKKQLAEVPPLIDLPLDRPRSPLYGNAGLSLSTALSTETTAAIRSFARQEAVTPYVVMLSLWGTVLARLCSQEDLPIGSPIAGRNRQEIEPLIGFFVNTLVLRLRLDGEVSFRQLVARVQEVNAEASANQDLPFERLVEELAPSRSLDHSPLFQVSFAFQTDPGSSGSGGEAATREGSPTKIQIRPQAGSNPVSMFDLTLALKQGERQIRGSLVARAALFDLTTLQRLLRFFNRLIGAVLADPDRRLSTISMLAAAQRQQLLVEWNDTCNTATGGAAETETLASLLSRQARRTPDRIALSHEDRFFTYAELARRSRALAGRLARLGVGAESVVAVCMTRSPELVIAIHAVILAGGAYLPIDPDLPAERIAFVVEDGAVEVILTLPSLASGLPSTGREVVEVDTTFDPLSDGLETPAPRVEPDNRAYVIFTSGSTGKPKGVVNSHRGVVNRLRWMQRAYPLGGSDRVVHKTPFSFDVSVWELFWPFLVGAELVVARPDGHKDAAYLARLIHRRQVSTVHFVPSMLSAFLADSSLSRPGRDSPLRSLRWVIASGEALVPEVCQRFAACSVAVAPEGGPRLENLYGPTEAAIDVTRWSVGAGAGSATTIPLGSPIDNLAIHLLDARGSALPIGAPGELLIGGVGLARGYLNRPALTAERFVPNPVTGQQGTRLYRSGDLARRRASGAIEFLGRLDQQVKVRGFRIELGEIEAALSAVPGVLDAAVLVRADSSGTARLVAYLVADPAAVPEGLPAAAPLRRQLGERLPEHMVPSVFVPLESLPRTTSGKVDRKALPETLDGRLETGEGYRPPSPGIEGKIAAIWREVLDVDRVGAGDNFFDLGGHSLLLIRVQSRLREELGEEIEILDFFRYPTVTALAQRLRPGGEETAGSFREHAERRRAQLSGEATSTEVAIVGIAARFPKARTAEEFWENLRDGVDCITFFDRQELLDGGVPEVQIDQPNYIPARGWYEGIDQFDARLFGVSPREAELMDPQHRVFMECVWEALEHAGHSPSVFPGRIALFGGVGLNYYVRNLLSNPMAMEGVTRMQVALGNDKDFLATRISYKLDLRGSSVTVQTACSSSLVGVHMACRALAQGECEMALAGGVGISTFDKAGYTFQEGGIASSDGHNRSFDVGADGSVGGDGAGVVVLRRLADALAAGDTIYGVIRGTALNNDGSNKVGFTAPSIEGQAEAIATAQVVAGVDPSEVSYVETHGTATPLGDPIEIAALREVFGKTGGAKSCALGSVKSNIGHTDTAAGVAGLIKTVLSLHHKQIPPSLFFDRPNPKIDFDNSPLYVNTELAEWRVEEGKRRIAGVSAFGLGGTNAHVVVEEGPERAPSGPSRRWQLLPLSGMSKAALDAVNERLASHLAASPEIELADVAYTLQQGRTRLPCRQILVAKDAKDAAEALASRDPRRILVSIQEDKQRPVVWLLPGLGDHYPGMGRELYATEETFRQAVDRCCDLLSDHLGEDLRSRLFPQVEGETGTASEEGSPGGEVDLRALLRRGEAARPAVEGPLDRTRWAQPAVFVIEYALAQLWLEWGVVPEAMIGYSLGEYSAACLAGVLSLPDALRLVAERARLIDSLPAGVMLGVPLGEEEIRSLLAERFADTLSLAAISGPELCVVAGTDEAVSRLEDLLSARDLVSLRLQTTHAFHSHMMRPIADRLATVVASIEVHAPRIPYLSNVTGAWVSEADVRDPAYWVRHLCEPVRFHQGLCELLEDPRRVLLEVGPGQALSTTAMQHPARAEGQLAVTSIRDARQAGSDVAYLLQAAGRLWLAGVVLDWRGLASHERRHRLALPTYPFEHQRYWVERLAPQPLLTRLPGAKTALVGDWFYLPEWRPTQPLPTPRDWPSEGAAARWLVLVDERGWSEELARRLEEQGQVVERLSRSAEDEDFAALFDPLLERLRDEDRLPGHIVHGWSLDAVVGSPEAGAQPPIEGFDAARFERAQQLGLYAATALVASLARLGVAEEISLTVLTSGHRAVDRAEEVRPELATLPGALTVVAQEYRNIHCRTLDLDPTATPATAVASGLLAKLVAEVAPRSSEETGAEKTRAKEFRPELTVALRGRARWVLGYKRLPLSGEPPGTEKPDPGRPGLRQGGVYLLTGGFGYVAGIVAAKLARRFGARLALVGRTAMPPREKWDRWLEEHDERHPVSLRVTRVRELEAAGAEVLALSADVANSGQLQAAVTATRDRFGALHGVFHLAAVMSDSEMMMSVSQVDGTRCAPQFRSKVEALYTLDGVLAPLEESGELEFCLLFSSMASVLGGLGFTAYAAANAFVDAFAARQQQAGRYRWLAANFDGWDRVERKVAAITGAGSSVNQYIMSPAESAEAIHRLLSLEAMGQVVVSTGDLDERIGRWVEFTAQPSEESGGGEEANTGHARPDLQTPFVAPSTETEVAIAELWSGLLGIAEIGVHDDFFQLGGDSLLATQIAARIRGVLKVDIPLRSFFTASTIAQLAELASEEGRGEELSAIELALAEIEGLTEEDLDSVLDQGLEEVTE